VPAVVVVVVVVVVVAGVVKRASSASKGMNWLAITYLWDARPP
jgi:hypothetical protein